MNISPERPVPNSVEYAVAVMLASKEPGARVQYISRCGVGSWYPADTATFFDWLNYSYRIDPASVNGSAAWFKEKPIGASVSSGPSPLLEYLKTDENAWVRPRADQPQKITYTDAYMALADCRTWKVVEKKLVVSAPQAPARPLWTRSTLPPAAMTGWLTRLGEQWCGRIVEVRADSLVVGTHTVCFKDLADWRWAYVQVPNSSDWQECRISPTK